MLARIDGEPGRYHWQVTGPHQLPEPVTWVRGWPNTRQSAPGSIRSAACWPGPCRLPAPGGQVRYLGSGSAVGVDAQVTKA
jgi:hypothetical protein